jgi:carboxyl-terminal processing protease
MTRFSYLLTALFLSFSFASGALAKTEKPGLTCPLVPVLTESFLKTHVAIKSPSDEIYNRTANQMIKRLDPSKALLLQSDVDALRPKLIAFLRSMRSKPDCKEIDAIKPLLVKRSEEQLAYAKEVLTEKYKLDESVEFQLDPEKRTRPNSLKESQERQMTQIHFQISNYLLTDMKLPKARSQLVHRYELNLKRMNELKSSDLYDYMVNAFASALDPHSNYLSPEATEDFRINMQLSLEGIGASLSNEDGYTVIQELIPGGSAARSNQLLPKDKIIAVGQGRKGEMLNVIDMDLKDVVRKIRGKAGTTVRLTILREKPEVQRVNVTLVRSKVQLEDDAAKVEFHERVVDGKKLKLARVELPGFYGGQRRTDRTSYKDVLKAVEQANKEGAEGILLDLSSNSGGLLDEAVRIAGLFIGRGNIVATKDSDGEVQMLDDIDPRVQFNGPLVILVSRLSASASEIVAGALQDYRRAIVVGGDHTYGKGSVQAVLNLQNDFGLIKVTTGLFFLPGGKSTQHQGISSDIVFPNPFSTRDIGEKHLDYSLPPDNIRPFLSTEANEGNLWTPVSKAEVEKLRILSEARIGKSKDFAEILKELRENEERKGLIRLSDLRKKESEQKKKNKDLAPKQIARERNKPQIDEALNVLGDFVHLRKHGSGKLLTRDKAPPETK